MVLDLLLNLGILLMDGLSILLTGNRRFDFRERVSSDDGGFALGIERRKNVPYLEIRVGTRLGTGRERYRLAAAEYGQFLDDHTAGAAFAEECRAGTHDARRFIPRRRARR
jgi:hypothetical protein